MKHKRTSRKKHRPTAKRSSRRARRPGAWLAVIRPIRKLAKNVTVGGIDAIEKIAFPALGATGGLLAAQWLGSKVAPSWMPGSDPRLLSAGASLAVAYGAYMLGDSVGLSENTQMTVAAGAGVAALLPWVPPAMLTGAPFTSAPVQAPLSGFYQRGMLSGLMVDVSHAGAPYKGMLGLGADPAEQSAVDDVMNIAEAVSTVEPIDMALPTGFKKTVRTVREQMGTPGDRGWAGGLYARNIFSGMAS